MQQVETYQERSREYLVKAFEELEAGDLTQASEKGWGAAAQIVKAVADERGMDHRSHRAILLAAQELTQEAGDNDLEVHFAFASQLHVNFYEATLNDAGVAMRLRQVAQFVDRIELLLPPE